MAIMSASDDTFPDLVQQAGYVLAFFDSEVGYGGKDRIRALARKLAREQADWLRVVLVIREDCPASSADANPGSFRLYLDGKKISALFARKVTMVMPWLAQSCPRLAAEQE